MPLVESSADPTGESRRLPPLLVGSIWLVAYSWTVLRYFVVFWLVALWLHLPYGWPGALLLAVIATIAVVMWSRMKKHLNQQGQDESH
jgi:hypothetical protein